MKSIALDMWDPYIAATKGYVPDAEKKIVFERIHVFRYMTDAVDMVRKNEAKTLSAVGDGCLKGTKYL